MTAPKTMKFLKNSTHLPTTLPLATCPSTHFSHQSDEENFSIKR